MGNVKMSNIITDVILYIKGHLQESDRTIIEGALLSSHGIIDVTIRDTRPHFIFVKYMPKTCSSLSLVNEIRTVGFSAKIIGI